MNTCFLFGMLLMFIIILDPGSRRGFEEVFAIVLVLLLLLAFGFFILLRLVRFRGKTAGSQQKDSVYQEENEKSSQDVRNGR